MIVEREQKQFFFSRQVKINIFLLLLCSHLYSQSNLPNPDSINIRNEINRNFSSYQDSTDIVKMCRSSDQNDKEDTIKTKFEPMPILSYDSNTGFGFGAKAFLLNFIKLRESLDVIVFLSTKGEKWFQALFSIPDFELRQGTVYPLAVDLSFTYNKFIVYNFFGVGNSSQFEDKENYKRLVTEAAAVFSRGISKYLVSQIGFKFKKIESWNFDNHGQLISLSRTQNHPLLQFSTLYINTRFDLRDSYINPTKGVVIQANLDWTPDIRWNDINFIQWSFWIQSYTRISFAQTIFAARFGVMNIIGTDLPIQSLIPIGGNNTLRGYLQDRFLDKSAGLVNLEFRFPVYWRFGGIIGADFGRVWPSFNQLSLTDWHGNAVAGIRFYMDTYVVRADLGISPETLGIYFNFGHIF